VSCPPGATPDCGTITAGVLYYGDSAANGVKASTFVEELTTRAKYDHFISAQPDNILTVIQVSGAHTHLWKLQLRMNSLFEANEPFESILGQARDGRDVPYFQWCRHDAVPVPLQSLHLKTRSPDRMPCAIAATERSFLRSLVHLRYATVAHS